MSVDSEFHNIVNCIRNFNTGQVYHRVAVLLKTISNEAKEYFRRLEKTSKRLIRVEEHLKIKKDRKLFFLTLFDQNHRIKAL